MFARITYFLEHLSSAVVMETTKSPRLIILRKFGNITIILKNI